jgi:hypothetical protein
MRWYYAIGRKVWPYELWHFFFRDRRTRSGPTLTRFLGEPREDSAEALDAGLELDRDRAEVLEPGVWMHTVRADLSPLGQGPSK